MPQESLSVSILLTQEEYMQFSVQMYRRQVKKNVSFLTLLGGIIAIVAIAGFFFGHYISLSSFSAAGLLLISILMLCYEGAIAPMLVRGAAARAYEEKEDLRTANQYIFTQDEVQIHNARMEGTLPLSWMTAWTRTGNGFWISFGQECDILIPIRLLDEKECDQLERWLQTKMPQ